MRRSDREVTDPAKIEEIFAAGEYMHLGFQDGGEVYIVPLSYGYILQDGCRSVYFHSAPEGRKVTLAQKQPTVGFELETGYALRTGETACTCTARFCSIIGTGRLRIVTDPAEKLCGLEAIMRHTAGKDGWRFDEKAVEAVCVLRMDVERLSCKEHK